MPIGNLTSQLFANIYLDPFDHFIKERVCCKHYIRYTDDFILLHDNPVALVSLLPVIRRFLSDGLKLELHPTKIELRKLRQGIDFLGYVTLPHYRVLRTKTKRRMLKRLTKDNAASYLGLLRHCRSHRLSVGIMHDAAPRLR